jgi:hypothetical protein
MKTPRIPALTNLKGIELACQNASIRIADNLTYLNYAFGLCVRVIESRDSGDKVVPTCFMDDTGEGARVYPNDEWGHFCFWDIDDPMAVASKDQSPWNQKFLKYKGACIFYFDLQQMNLPYTYQEIKSMLRDDILKQFGTGFMGCGANIQLTGFFDRSVKDVYKDLYDDKIKDLTLMPHCVFRVECDIHVRQFCDIFYSNNTLGMIIATENDLGIETESGQVLTLN